MDNERDGTIGSENIKPIERMTLDSLRTSWVSGMCRRYNQQFSIDLSSSHNVFF